MEAKGWKGTVIKVREYPEGDFDPITGLMLEKQAKITWDIGFKAGYKEALDSIAKDFEYCDSAGDNFTGIGYFISEEEWQSKLKEWGGINV